MQVLFYFNSSHQSFGFQIYLSIVEISENCFTFFHSVLSAKSKSLTNECGVKGRKKEHNENGKMVQNVKRMESYLKNRTVSGAGESLWTDIWKSYVSICLHCTYSLYPFAKFCVQSCSKKIRFQCS